ncbi:MAG: tryptophan synthase subunit alpha [Nitrospirales bacterium]|jgi:tryptophan synthase alpha chain|nr:MAG: tryptophan synthase subunit alpha [Nitrospirales bacterium]
MTRIGRAFKRLKTHAGKAFIPYIMAGDPSFETTKETVLMLEQCGADIVELGVPFSDPLADGPTIQRASERALKNNVTLRKVIAFVKDIRSSTQIPLILMTYFNPVFKYGSEHFIRDAADAGVDGLIIPDLPPDEAADFIKHARKANLDTIFLLAPTSTEDRIRIVAKVSRGFLYYVSITGTTGSGLLFDGSMERLISEIKGCTDTPVAVGFGVSTPEDAATVAKIADGVIVGSAIVNKLHKTPDTLKDYVISLRQAIR